jgi:isopentenyl-diphosphate delta-isomerase type 1
MTATEQVILVDENDNPIGIAEKLRAHQENLRHRAFSVFILRKNPHLEVLLQQRADHKYHSAGLWTNTCCSHPRPGEDILAAGQRRLKEEMGIEAKLTNLGWFHYVAHFENGLVENEIDHVLIGNIDQSLINPNPEEVQNFKWISLQDLKIELAKNPSQFTAWLLPAIALVEKN